MSQRLNGVDPPVRRSAANAISEDTILDAATALMTTIGIRRTTMADVARSAGVSRATLYRRYPNVESLAAQVTTREFTLIAERMPTTDEPASRQAMVLTLVHLVREVRAHPLLRRIVELDPEFLTPYLLHRTGRTSRSQLEMIETMIGRGQSIEQIRDGDPHRLATTVLQMAWSFALTGPVFTEPGKYDELDDELADLLERYLRP